MNTRFAMSERVKDQLFLADEGLILMADSLLRISPIAAVLVSKCLEQPSTLPELVDATVAIFGSPADGDEVAAVRRQLAQLVDADVLLEVEADGL